jgi:hypothetical protein
MSPSDSKAEQATVEVNLNELNASKDAVCFSFHLIIRVAIFSILEFVSISFFPFFVMFRCIHFALPTTRRISTKVSLSQLIVSFNHEISVAMR